MKTNLFTYGDKIKLFLNLIIYILSKNLNYNVKILNFNYF